MNHPVLGTSSAAAVGVTKAGGAGDGGWFGRVPGAAGFGTIGSGTAGSDAASSNVSAGCCAVAGAGLPEGAGGCTSGVVGGGASAVVGSGPEPSGGCAAGTDNGVGIGGIGVTGDAPWKAREAGVGEAGASTVRGSAASGGATASEANSGTPFAAGTGAASSSGDMTASKARTSSAPVPAGNDRPGVVTGRRTGDTGAGMAAGGAQLGRVATGRALPGAAAVSGADWARYRMNCAARSEERFCSKRVRLRSVASW